MAFRNYNIIRERKIEMENNNLAKTQWSNREIHKIRGFRDAINNIEERSIRAKIIDKEQNKLDFYQITPK